MTRAANTGGALHGVRVIDASGIMGAYCSKLLADFGADVVKVEPVQGDVLRARPPFKNHMPNAEGSLAFAFYHVNKRGITLDRTHADAAPIWGRLVETADVVIHDSPAVSGEEALAHKNQIVCTVTPYGVTGPYRNMPATHLTSSAMGGSFVGERPGTKPVAMPDLQMYDGTGAHAALAILVALRNRPAVGGQFIDVSAHEVLASKNMAVQRFMQSGYDELPSPGDVAPPAGRWQCTDGQVELLVYQSAQWEAFKGMLGNPPELDDPEMKSPQGRRRQKDLITRIVSKALGSLSKIEVFERAQAARIPCAPINHLIEFVEDPQTTKRGIFADKVEHRYLGAVPVQRVYVASEPLTVVTRPAPLRGEHNEDVYVNELGFSHADVAAWREKGIV